MGSMVYTSHRDDVLDMLSKGLEQGGEVACGGNALDRDGAFLKDNRSNRCLLTAYCSKRSCSDLFSLLPSLRIQKHLL